LFAAAEQGERDHDRLLAAVLKARRWRRRMGGAGPPAPSRCGWLRCRGPSEGALSCT